MVKTDVKNVLLNSLFFPEMPSHSFFFLICIISLLSASWILFLNLSIVLWLFLTDLRYA